MKYIHPTPKSLLSTAVAAILSLSLVFKPAYAADPGVMLTGTNSLSGTLDGSNSTGYFVKSGSMTISNATLQNFTTKGGDGSGGGAGLGGALFINTGASVTLNNVNFLSNNAIGGNGGVGTIGGTLNNLSLLNSTPVGTSGVSGYTPDNFRYTDIEGTTGTKGTKASINPDGFGGIGGAGGAGGNGGDRSESLILGVVTATVGVVDVGIEIAAASANPFTANVAIGLAPKVVSAAITLGDSIASLVYFDKSLAAGQIGLGGTGGVAGNGGAGGFGFGGGTGGAGGNGGNGGANWSGSAFTGGAAGGDAGDGGVGGLGGFGAGGGKGGNGGIGGAGASFGPVVAQAAVPAVTENVVIPAIYSKGYYLDDDNNPMTPTIWVEIEGNLKTAPSSYSFDHDSNNTTPDVTVESKLTSAQKTVEIIKTPGKPAVEASVGGARPNGADGAGGAGGAGGFGAGVGTEGATNGALAAGGNGGSGMGGAIFVRAGATLTITGNAVFDGNGIRGGEGQAAGTSNLAGMSGIGIGSDLYMMKAPPWSWIQEQETRLPSMAAPIAPPSRTTVRPR